jgi:large subunit ribosomal protein L22
VSGKRQRPGFIDRRVGRHRRQIEKLVWVVAYESLRARGRTRKGIGTIMEAKAVGRYVRTSPRKARQVAEAIRGRAAGDALNVLALTPRKAARLIEKILKSAVANAREKGGRDQLDALTVSEIQVGPGPTLKRWLPRARGRATPIRKRTSHIRIILRDVPQSSVPRRT